ncbi:MAG: hypothetical protein GY811_22010 [Myxococcales bacterium]|nr:hypothetical protein [Myxococcales bacterium]
MPNLIAVWTKAVSISLALHKAAHGPALIKPKHHYLWHVPDQPAEDGIWLDAFVLERKHNLLRSRSQEIDNPENFERSALTAMLACFLEEAKEAPRSRAKAWRTPELDSTFGHSGRNLACPLWRKMGWERGRRFAAEAARRQEEEEEEEEEEEPLRRAETWTSREASIDGQMYGSQDRRRNQPWYLGVHMRVPPKNRGVAALRIFSWATARRTSCIAARRLAPPATCWWRPWNGCARHAQARPCGGRAATSP